MKFFGVDGTHDRMLRKLERFVTHAEGLVWSLEKNEGQIIIFQTVDHKAIRFCVQTIEEVLERQDRDAMFLQVNFTDGKKILVTDGLIGFKPLALEDFDMDRLPKVVTTSDLISVLEAIEELELNPQTLVEDQRALKKIYSSIVGGAENVGFEMTAEKAWLQHFSKFPRRAVA